MGLPELNGVRVIWFSDWYDGPVTGLAEYDGHEYWFVMVVNEGGETWDFEPRVYILHRLTPDQLAQEWDAHRDFAAARIPGCMHSPPCPSDSPDDREALATLWERWPSEREDEYQEADAIGWFSGTSAVT